MLVPIPGQLVPSVPAPAPAGLTYVDMRSQQQPGGRGGDGGDIGAQEEQFYSFDDFQQVCDAVCNNGLWWLYVCSYWH